MVCWFATIEREGCEGNIDHIRTTPKRKIGLGKVEFLNGKNIRDNEEKNESGESKKTAQQGDQLQEPPAGEPQPVMHQPATAVASNTPKTWAFIVNPSAASATPPVVHVSENVFIVAKRENNEVNDVAAVTAQLNAADLGGQFSDAEESDHDDDSSDEESTDDDGYADPEKEVSDEECDVYILDPEEVDERNRDLHGLDCTVEEELMSDFPSLAASLHVPYEGDDVDGVLDAHKDGGSLRPLTEEEVGERKKQALTPLSKSGKLYNSFPKYSNLLKPKATATKENFAVVEPADGDHETEEYHVYNLTDDANGMVTHSRIIGGAATSGQELEVEDDGEGWITCSRDIQKMKASGTAFPTRGSKGPHGENTTSPKPVGPPIWKRAACATTDFAIQNVILQMNLELLSVDGVKIRRLKSWILRCGACFTVHADGDGVGPLGTKRLFCSRCGSDMMQRISASVDGKSGRLRLHLSQRHKNNLRGTKFSLPKPGTVRIIRLYAFC
jgi:RNA-binding protein NOB1